MDTRFSDPKGEHLWKHSRIGFAFVGPDGSWLRVNPYLCELLGFTEIELLESTFQDVTHPEDLHADETMVRHVLEGRIDEYFMMKRYLPKLGPPIWIRLNVSRIAGEDGEFAFFFSQITPVDPLLDAAMVKNPSPPEVSFDDIKRVVVKYWKVIAFIISTAAAAAAAWRTGLG